MILWFIGALLGFIAFDSYLIFNKGKARRKRGQPTIGDIWTRPKLQIESSGTMPRCLIEQAMEAGGQPAVRAAIEDHYKKYDFDDWSIDFCYSAYNPITQKNQSGFWAEKEHLRADQATVFFYSYIEPPPPPKPEPRPTPRESVFWTETKERERIALYLAGPSAFWLNLDFGDTPNPLDLDFEWAWMRGPAFIPEWFEPADEKVQRAAEIMTVGEFDIIEKTTIGDRNSTVYVFHDGGDFTLTAPEYRQARRLALEMMR